MCKDYVCSNDYVDNLYVDKVYINNVYKVQERQKTSQPILILITSWVNNCWFIIWKHLRAFYLFDKWDFYWVDKTTFASLDFIFGFNLLTNICLHIFSNYLRLECANVCLWNTFSHLCSKKNKGKRKEKLY